MKQQTKTDICEALPQVDLDFMNAVHCEEVLLTQNIQQALESNQAPAKIDTLLGEWVEHTVRHFAREERLMEEYRFLHIACIKVRMCSRLMPYVQQSQAGWLHATRLH